MTKKEKQIILKAANRLAEGMGTYSCNAITEVDWSIRGFDLAEKYADFYSMSPYAFWFPPTVPPSVVRNYRILLLLTFAELG